MTRFCLVRHGQTDWNLEGRYQGQSDVPLNAAGIAQAQALARRLKDEHFDAAYSSDLSRARDTALAISAVHGGLAVNIDPRLREINQGRWEGVQVEKIRERYAGLWLARQTDPVSVRPPGGETVGEVYQRVRAALDEIAVRYPEGSVLIVSHGLALATILCTLQGIPLGQAYQHIPENSVPLWIKWPASDQTG